MSFWEVAILVLGTSLGSAVTISWTLHRLAPTVINKILDRYEETVHRQSLAEARRLVDANREYPARLDAGAPARVHRMRRKK